MTMHSATPSTMYATCNHMPTKCPKCRRKVDE
jgi:hypothetical protein